MKSRLITLITAALGVAAYTHNSVGGPLVNEAQLAQAGMYPYWRAEVPLAKHDALKAGYLVDQSLYLITEHGTVFSLTAGEGLIRWGEKISEPDFNIYRPTHTMQPDGKGPVIIPTTTGVYVFDRFSGDILQQFTPEFPISGIALAIGNNLFMGSADGRMYSFLRRDCITGKPMKLWEVAAGGPVTSSPILYGNGLLLFASQDGTVYSCFTEDKELNWSYNVGGEILGNIAMDTDSVYAASTNRSLYKIDLRTGRFVWRFRMPRPLFDGPVAAADTVFQFCESKGLSAIDPANGNERWQVPEAVAFNCHTKGGDVLTGKNGSLLLVDHETGDIKNHMRTMDNARAVRNTTGSAVYVFGRSGAVECLQLDEVPYLRRQQVSAARQLLQRPPVTETVSASKASKAPKAKAVDPFRSPRDGRKD